MNLLIIITKYYVAFYLNYIILQEIKLWIFSSSIFSYSKKIFLPN